MTENGQRQNISADSSTLTSNVVLTYLKSLQKSFVQWKRLDAFRKQSRNQDDMTTTRASHQSLSQKTFVSIHRRKKKDGGCTFYQNA